ncbi:MAG: hypothetical protein ACJ8AO_05540, partial [Gemmatimonadaceae bacterium]
LVVTPVVTATQVTINYSLSAATSQLVIDNGAPGAIPASGFVVARDLPTGADKIYVLSATANGQTVTRTVVVQRQQVNPPWCSIRRSTRTKTQETLYFAGGVGQGSAAPLEWCYATNNGTPTAWSTATLTGTTLVVTRASYYETEVALFVRQPDGQTAEFSYVVQSVRDFLDDTSGKVRRAVTRDDGDYDLRSTASDGLTGHASVKHSGGIAINRGFAKGGASDPDTADSVPDGTTRRTAATTHTDGSGRPVKLRRATGNHDLDADVLGGGIGLAPGNLVANGGGQEGALATQATGWSLLTGNGTVPATDAAKYGDRSLKTVSAGGTDNTSYQQIAVVAGRVYRVRGWIKVSGASTAGSGAIIQFDPNGSGLTVLDAIGFMPSGATYPAVGVQLTGTPLTQDWTYFEVIELCTVSVNANLLLCLGYGAAGTGTVWWDGIEVVCESTTNVTLPEGAKEYGGRLVRRAFVKAGDGLADNADAVPDGSTRRTAATTHTDGSGRPIKMYRGTAGDVAAEVLGASLAATPDNLVANGGGQEGAPTVAAPGWTAGVGVLYVDTNFAKFGDRSLRIDVVANSGYAYQDFAARDGDVFELSGWVMMASVVAVPGPPATNAGIGLNIDIVSGITSLTVLGKRQWGNAPAGWGNSAEPDVGLTHQEYTNVIGDQVWVPLRSVFRVNGTGTLRLYAQIGYTGNFTGSGFFDGIVLRRLDPTTPVGGYRGALALVDAGRLTDLKVAQAALAAGMRAREQSNPLSYSTSGYNTANINVAAHNVRVPSEGGYADVGYGSATLNADTQSFRNDPSNLGGGGAAYRTCHVYEDTYLAGGSTYGVIVKNTGAVDDTTPPDSLADLAGRRYLGWVRIPGQTIGAGGTSGGGTRRSS